MYQISRELSAALSDQGKIRRIRGSLRELSGTVIDLTDKIWNDQVTIRKQCVSDEQKFGIGQLYTGELDITIELETASREELRGGRITLDFGAEGIDEWIPLGVWNVTDPQRSAQGILRLKAADSISRLDVPIPDSYVGTVYLSSMMRRVTELTGVEFAQTAAEVMALTGAPEGYEPWGSCFPASCRAVVSAIAEYIGGIAFADRQGRIAFRRLGTSPVLTIPAALRHSIRLGEYSCGVRGVSCTDQFGYTFTQPITGAEVGAELTPALTGNPFLWDTADETQRDRQYAYGLRYAAEGLSSLPDWVPGEVDYYGNPALDLGDMVEITGGINGEQSSLFFITSDSWQFRGPQRLISAGAGESAASGSSGSAASSVMTTINLTKSLTAVPLLSYEGELFTRLRTVARGGFSVRNETIVFVELTANLTGDGDIRLHVLYDGVKQTVHSRETAPERSTVSYSVQLTAQQGIHTIEVEAAGNAVLERITALVWGQDITAVQPEFSSEGDYEYTVSAGAATVDKYIGRGTMPQIPDTLGGAPVRVIGGNSFTDSDVECVYIPDGVEVIEGASEQFEFPEFIEVSGDTHFGTGCVPVSGELRTEWELEITSAKAMNISGNWSLPGSGSYNWLGWNPAKGFGTYQYNPTVIDWYPAPSEYRELNTRYSVTAVYRSGFRSLTINGNEFTTTSAAAVGAREIWLFSNGRSEGRDKAYCKLFGLRIFDGGELIGDLVPARRLSDGMTGLMNRQTNQFCSTNGVEPASMTPGAFRNAAHLTRVRIPETVKTIGAEAFRNTALRSVTIAQDCTYSETSFPEGCEVNFYGGGGEYGQLVDCNGVEILDCEAVRILVKGE